MYGPDGLNVSATMPAIAPESAPGEKWFKPSDVGLDNATEFTEDFFNELIAEFKNLIEGLDSAFVKGSCNQLAALIVPLLTVAGKFATSVSVGLDIGTGLYDARFGVRPYISPEIVLECDRVYASIYGGAWDDLVPVVRLNAATGDAVLHDVEVTGKVSNASGADVVFDDGITVEAKGTLTGGLKTVVDPVSPPSAVLAAGSWTVTLNAVGGCVIVPFDGTDKLEAGDYTDVFISNTKINAASRTYYGIDTGGYNLNLGGSVSCAATGFYVNITNNDNVDVTHPVTIYFDVINPA